MVPTIQAATTAVQKPLYPESQLDVLNRKLSFYKAEYESVLKCYGELDNDYRQLKKRNRALQKALTALASHQQ